MFFFFKQKTAYEMRISDWSSDVCSSDLSGMMQRRFLANMRATTPKSDQAVQPGPPPWSRKRGAPSPISMRWNSRPATDRSEEHTSELQSLMRISYAVFCLKKKKIIQAHTRAHYHTEQESITIHK